MNPEFQKNIDRIDTLNETKLQENLKSVNIMKLEELFDDVAPESIKEICHKLNNIFTEEFEKKGIDFSAALKSKVENPIV